MRWTTENICRVVRLRQHSHPKNIAEIMGCTESAINRILSIEKQKRGIEYPKLRHGKLKWDKAIVAQWRVLMKQMKRSEISELYGVNPAVISRKFAADLHGELVW